MAFTWDWTGRWFTLAVRLSLRLNLESQAASLDCFNVEGHAVQKSRAILSPPNTLFLSSQTLTSSPGFLRVFQFFSLDIVFCFFFLTFLSPYLVSDHLKKKLFLIYLSKALKTDLWFTQGFKKNPTCLKGWVLRFSHNRQVSKVLNCMFYFTGNLLQ